MSEISSLKNGNKGKKREKADYFLYFYYLRIKSSKTIITLQSYPIPKLLHETYLSCKICVKGPKYAMHREVLGHSNSF